MKKLLIILVLLQSVLVSAENIQILVPYAGYLTNSYEEYSTDDSGPMAGLFYQFVNPGSLQFNVFLYGTNELYEKPFLGAHFNGDYYIPTSENGELLLGGGLEIINLGIDITPYYEIDSSMMFYVPFLRVAYQYEIFNKNSVKLSLMPWVGAQYDISRVETDVTGDFDGPGPMPTMTVSDSSDSETLQGLAGMKLGINLYHFIDISLKYKLQFSEGEYSHSIDALNNIYFTRDLGLSYRFKYSQSSSDNTYHLLGLMYKL